MSQSEKLEKEFADLIKTLTPEELEQVAEYIAKLESDKK